MKKAKTMGAAAAPRDRVLAAARDLFLEHGYLATTIGAIADRAAVALRTIYSGYGSKVGILAAVQDQAVAGDGAERSMIERDWVARLTSMTREQALGSVVSHFAEATERAAPILQVIQTASSDAAVRELLDRLHEQRIATCRHVAGLIVDDRDAGRLADQLYALLGVEMHQLLVVRRGWTLSQWESWALDSLGWATRRSDD